MTKDEAKRIIEALLFASSKPVTINELAGVLEDTATSMIEELIRELNREYESQNRSFGITEIAGGFQLAADAYYAPWVKKLLSKETSRHLSIPSLETLAIIAYRQPITRGEIETIRGVNIDGIIENLLEKNLIRTGGRKEAPGRPFVYVVTDEFLSHFGLMSLEDLPKLKEFTEKDIQSGNGNDALKQEDGDGAREAARRD